MRVEIIKKKEMLEKTKPFYIDKLLWGTEKCPRTYGYMGYLSGEGFLIKMICEERDPYRTYTGPNAPVYLDSTVEAFLMFEAQNSDAQGIYLNFEINSNGAMLAAYGKNRSERTFIPDEIRKEIVCEARIEKEYWTVELKIPVSVLEQIYGPLMLEQGRKFRCNFYKISETKEIEHYASYAKIESKTPNFHLPEFFETAILE